MKITVQQELGIYFQKIPAYQKRQEVLDGKTYTVVPVTMMKEGVHSGSRGPLLHLASELGKVVSVWNGIPVTVHHPKKDNEYVSANSPEVLQNWSVGRIFNAHMDQTSLKAEAWIDMAKLNNVSTKTKTKIDNNEIMEVSVGMFSDEEETEGTYNNENYHAIARNNRPDHLALLPDEIGACSVEDGCGIRTYKLNEKKGGSNVVSLINNALKYSGTETSSWSAPNLSDFGVTGQWGDLSTSEKTRIANHYLLGSSNSESFADLKLPVVNASTGKLNEKALRAVISGRGAQVTGVSAQQKSAARRRAYNLLNSEFDAGLEIPETLSVHSGEYFEVCEELNKQGYSLQSIIANEDKGLQAIVDAVRNLVYSMESERLSCWVEEVYPDYVIYRKRTRDENEGSKLFKQNYSFQNDVAVFVGDPVQVTKNITYSVVPNQNPTVMKRTKFNNNKKEENMSETCTPCVKQKVDKLIAHSSKKFCEEDREWLEALQESQLDKLIPEEKQIEPAPIVHAVEPPKTNWRETVPKDVLEAYDRQVARDKQLKDNMVSTIIANTAQGVWNKESLEALPYNTLESVFKSVRKETQETIQDYSLQSAGISSYSNNQEIEPMAPAGVTFKK